VDELRDVPKYNHHDVMKRFSSSAAFPRLSVRMFVRSVVPIWKIIKHCNELLVTKRGDDNCLMFVNIMKPS